MEIDFDDDELADTDFVSELPRVHDLLLGSQLRAMAPGSTDGKWPLVVNLSNSIIGVSVLAMPFCLQQCGILLSCVLMLISCLLTRVTCHLLVKAAFMARKRSYEYLAYAVYGPWGKLAVEVLTILFLMSNMCAFTVVVGDLGPGTSTILAELGRVPVMVLFAVCAILPLSLLRNIDSLSHVSGLAFIFYALFVLRMAFVALPRLLTLQWIQQVNWWRPEGVLQCLPIFALSLSCQTQLFITGDCMREPSPLKMDNVVSGSVNLCASVYLLVTCCNRSIGFFGYVAFNEQVITGDVLVHLEPTYLTQLCRLGFMFSVAVGYPLMLFPCRSAIYTMIFDPDAPAASSSNEHAEFVLPPVPFRILTCALVAVNVLIAMYIPNVEFVLGITGSVIGSTICVILPGALFMHLAPEHHFYSRLMAQTCVLCGVFMLVVCSFVTMMPPVQDSVLADVPLPPQPQTMTKSTQLHSTSTISLLQEQLINQANNGKHNISRVNRPNIPKETAKSENDEKLEPPLPLAPEKSNEPEKQAAQSTDTPPKKDVQSPEAKLQAEEKAPAVDVHKDKGLEKVDKSNKEQVVDEMPVAAADNVPAQAQADVPSPSKGPPPSPSPSAAMPDAEKILAELKQQRLAQDQLLAQQEQIVNQLKQHRDDFHAPGENAVVKESAQKEEVAAEKVNVNKANDESAL